MLLLDVVAVGGSVVHEAQHGYERDRGGVEGDEPDAEELVHGDVEEEGGFIEG